MCPNIATIENPVLVSFVRIWCEASVGGNVPQKTAIDPIVMGKAGILPIVWLQERNDDRFTCRLAGEEIVRAIGKPVRGRALSDIFSAKSAEILSAQWDKVLSASETCHNSDLFIGGDGRQHSGERVVLPLADKDGVARFVIGATVYERLRGPVEYSDRLATVQNDTAEFTPVDEVFQSFGVSVPV